MLNTKLLGSVSAPPAIYPEDVFSTYLYTGTGANNQTITNGIDLAGKGGMVWIKDRTVANDNVLSDTVRGVDGKYLISNSTAAQGNDTTIGIQSFNADGFTTNKFYVNESGSNYCSWTFREQAKFFDVITYTGDGTAGRTISHSLGSTPGMMIVKCTSNATLWAVYHTSLGNTKYLRLNGTNAAATDLYTWNNTSPTSSVFTVGDAESVNQSGYTYVAYLFAHDAGGFGAAGTDNVISCGSYTGNGSNTGPSINLGFEPQFLLVKSSSEAATDWYIVDIMRGFPVGSNVKTLKPNQADAEGEAITTGFQPTATGFNVRASWGAINANGGTYIYMAIRRPMKPPTSGTQVFSPLALNNATGTVNTTGFPVDLQILRNNRFGSDTTYVIDRLRGVSTTATETNNPYLTTPSTGAEFSYTVTRSWNNTGFATPSLFANASEAYWNFRRATGFFDVVCYTGNGSSTQIPHNLGAIPELCISKRRAATSSWFIDRPLNTSAYNQGAFDTAAFYDNWLPDGMGATSTTIRPPNSSSGQTMVMYLFATLAGVSKVGSYTGTGTTQTINCGFTSGARFVLVKRLDSTGAWYVWDTARGIVSGNDPFLLLNSTAAEDTSTDYIDPVSSGFEISSTAPAAINANGGSFLFLAIA